MKRLLPVLLLLLVGVTAANAAVVKESIALNGIHKSSVLPKAAPSSMDFTYEVASFYSVEEAGLADYYLILSDTNRAKYTREDGVVLTDGTVLFLDLYGATSESPVSLPEGTYTSSDEAALMTYSPDYSYVVRYGEDGKQVDSSYASINGPVNVVREADGDYVITAQVTVSGKTSTYTYKGGIYPEDSSIAPPVYNQIKQNLDLKLDGALAIYNGNLYESNTGVMWINLYDHEFNPETGGMLEDGFSLALMVCGKLFANPEDATLDSGTYTVAQNFKRYTWYPAREIDYMGMTVILGSYAKERNGSKYNDSYGYSYLKDGVIEIEDAGNGKFRITVDVTTTLGHTVKGEFEGEVPVIDATDGEKPNPGISTLEDDIVLDLDKIKTAHLWYNGVANGCQSFLVDIGSPSGRDKELDNGGDIMRLEFLLPEGETVLQEGTYTVLEEQYETWYEPYKMAKGYFSKTALGDLTGTRYMHFEEGRYYIMDHLAPANAGSVGVTRNADGTYTFNIALMCDRNFRMDGSWTGPVEVMNASNDRLTVADSELTIEFADADNIRVFNAPYGAQARILAVDGRIMDCHMDGDMINISSLAHGVYLLHISETTFKFVK